MKKIADFLLNTYLFIASAGACLVLSTYLLTGQKLQITPLVIFVFFSTLLIYNFHRVSNLFDVSANPVAILPAQLKKIFGTTKIMIIISITGILYSMARLRLETILAFFPIALITVAYSIPLLKIGGKKKRLREILFIKISTIGLVWAFTTVTIPLIDSGLYVFTKSSMLLFIERFLFVAAICIPFEIRDMEQEKKWGNTTLPHRVGIEGAKLTGVVALLIFIALVYFQFGISEDKSRQVFALPLYLSSATAILLIWLSNENRNKYYCRIFVDGTMHLQFILLILFKDML